MSSCNFNNLSFSTDSDYNYQYLGSHSSNVQSVPIQQSSQPMQKCTFQCVCCARLSMGSVCSCNLPKSNASTQTNNFEFPQETLMANNMWIKGTFEHGIVQKLILTTTEKHMPSSGKYTSPFSEVFNEVKTVLELKFPNYPIDNKKLKKRIQKAAQWKKYYEKKREEAKKSKESAWKFLTRKRKPLHSVKENQLLLEDTEEMGVHNRGFQPDTDSDSDVPLAELTKRKKPNNQ